MEAGYEMLSEPLWVLLIVSVLGHDHDVCEKYEASFAPINAKI